MTEDEWKRKQDEELKQTYRKLLPWMYVAIVPVAGGIGMFRPEGPAFFIALTALIFSAIMLAIVSFLLRR